MRVPRGFTFVELIMVVALVAILALIAVPTLQEQAMRRQVKEGLQLADIAKKGVQAAFSLGGKMPADNAAAGLPEPAKIVGNMISAVTVDQGAVTLTFGNNAGKSLDGKRLTLRPAIVPDAPVVPIAWVCHRVAVPQGMQVLGRDETDIPMPWLPVECRGAEKPAP